MKHDIPDTAEELRIVIYSRLSMNRSGLSTNCAIQVAECEEEAGWYARDHGSRLTIVEKFQEDDVSASRYSTKPRPLYEQMLSLIAQNQVDMVWATETERLVRRPREMEKLIDLAETTRLKYLYLTSDDQYDLSTPNGIYRARQAVNAAERESRKISERTKRKQAAKAREGMSNGGRRCFAYKAGNMELEPVETAILQEMGRKFLAGQGYTEISQWANDQGYKTAGGSAWFPVKVRNALCRKRYGGIRVHHDAEYPAIWPAVFDTVTWERIQLAVKTRSIKNSTTPRARRYLLTGIAYCGKCHEPLNGSKKKDRAYSKERRVYACMPRQNRAHCNGVARNADALDHYVTESLLAHLETPDLTKLLRRDNEDDGQLKNLLSIRETRKQRVTDLVDDYASGLLSRDQFARAKNTAEAELGKVEYEIASLNRKRTANGLVPAGASVREAWGNSDSDDWKRALTSLAIERVDVFPTKSRKRYVIDDVVRCFDPADVRIVWRELDLSSIAALVNERLKP